MVFPALYNSVKPYLQQDAVLYLRGKNFPRKKIAVSVLCDSVLQEEAFFPDVVAGAALREDRFPPDGGITAAAGSDRTACGKCAGLLLPDRPEEDALSPRRTGGGGEFGILCRTLCRGFAGAGGISAAGVTATGSAGKETLNKAVVIFLDKNMYGTC